MSDLERMLLGKLITAEAMTEAYNEGIRAEAFEEPLFQAIFAFIQTYWEKASTKSVPTPWALSQEFPGYEPKDETEDETWYLAQKLKQRYATNSVQNMLRAATDTMFSDPIGTLKTLHANAFSAAEVVVPRLTRTNMVTTIEEDRADYEVGEQYPQGMGVPYGLDLLDLHTGGQLPGELSVLGAVAKTGKTMFGLHVATSVLRQGYHPMVFSLEMGLKEIRQRLAAMFSGVSYDRLSHRRLSDVEKEKLWAGREELAALGDIAIERPEGGDRTVPALLARARQYGADWLFIDQLSHLEAGHKTYSRKEEYSSILKQLGNEISRPGLEIPCLLAAQMRRGDEEPTMESFADAAEVEREADICFGLSRNQDMRANRRMKIEILAARRSAPASYLLVWDLVSATDIRVDEEIR